MPAPGAAAWSPGLIHDIPTVKELIDRIMADAEQIIRQRLTGFLDGAGQRPVAARAIACRLSTSYALERLCVGDCYVKLD